MHKVAQRGRALPDRSVNGPITLDTRDIPRYGTTPESTTRIFRM
jgi:hypothetical protein